MDPWNAGDAYEAYMGRWSRPMARVFVSWLDIEPGSTWLDVGCGTGALTGVILDTAAPAGLTAVDPSPGFIGEARHRLGERPTLVVGDALSLPFHDESFDATVSGLALNFVPDPGAAVAEFRRVTVDGGVIAAYVWDYAGGMDMIRLFWGVALDLDPSIAHLDEATRFPLCHPERLVALFTSAGTTDVEVTGLEIPTRFESFEDFWQPFLGGQGPAPSYVMSLSESARERLRTSLAATLAIGDEGVGLSARAWAVRARR